MGAPFEVIAGRIAAYVAPLATVYPSMDDAEADFDAAWVKLGMNGDKNIEESGLTIHDASTSVDWRSLGTTMAVKNFLTSEDLRVEFTLADIRAEMWAIARGGHPAGTEVTTVAAGVGTSGYKKLDMVRDLDSIQTVALLLRQGQSPYGDGFFTQYEFPKAIAPGDGIDLVYVKGAPVAVHFNFHILYDTGINVKFGNAVAT